MASAAIAALHLHHHVRGSRLDYAGLTLAAAISWVGLPGPGEAALIAAAIAAAHGRLDLASVVFTAWIGAAIGGTCGWLIGRLGGPRVLTAGSWLRDVRERALARGNRFFERYGWVAVYFAPSWAAGINQMSAPRFLPANAVCSLLWALIIGGAAYALGPSARDVADDVGWIGSSAIVVLVVVSTVLARRRRRSGGSPPR